MPVSFMKRYGKRSFQRFSARFPCKFKDTRDDFGANVSLRDASATGVKLSTTEDLQIDDHVSLEVLLPDSIEPCIIKGEVIWLKNIQDNMRDVGIALHKTSLLTMSRLYRQAIPKPALSLR